ncbi:hypothetical protein [Alkalihalobacillus sp. AL-G]|uniref:hypothetical protein n=1 Tax=Alkalihalobacillus sp. AL-G TaxID=2926399 RepID=UPI00272D2369|nr:hypothetical protein [Alkalihalobacillus sp. AL-G]WLD92770.1 hypothetical protein MOJ78_17430 [Alkalihalobacillus sp. AL-G]
MMNFIKRIAGNDQGDAADCCGVEIKEIENNGEKKEECCEDSSKGQEACCSQIENAKNSCCQ